MWHTHKEHLRKKLGNISRNYHKNFQTQKTVIATTGCEQKLKIQVSPNVGLLQGN